MTEPTTDSPPEQATQRMEREWAHIQAAAAAERKADALGNPDAKHAATADHAQAAVAYHEAEMDFLGWAALEIGLLRADFTSMAARLDTLTERIARERAVGE